MTNPPEVLSIYGSSPVVVGDSERHVQLSVVEHHTQLEALPVSVTSRLDPQQPDLTVQGFSIPVRDSMPHCIQYAVQLLADRFGNVPHHMNIAVAGQRYPL